jgi:hypothetical protein
MGRGLLMEFDAEHDVTIPVFQAHYIDNVTQSVSEKMYFFKLNCIPFIIMLHVILLKCAK